MKRLILFIFLLPFSILHLFAQPWSQRAQMPGLARHRIFSFSIGSRGYIGCGWNGTVMYHDVWEYDPASNSWSQKADYPGGDRLCPFSFAIGPYGYVGAGLDNTLTSMNDFYQFDPVNNSWAQKSYFAGSPRFGCATAVLNNKGYVAMGDEWDPTYYRQNDLWVYDPSNDSWNFESYYPADGRRDPIGFTLGNEIYFGTGSDNNYQENNDLWSYDPSTSTWTQKTNCGTPIAQSTGFAVNGKGYVGLGQDQTGNDRNNFLQYDPVLNSWKSINNFAGAARENSFAFVIGNKAYVTCGTSGINYNDIWQFDPAYVTGNDERTDPVFSFSVFPDPVTDHAEINVNGSIEKEFILSLSDVQGKLLLSKNISSHFTFSREGLPAGIYFLKVTSGKNSVVQKLVLQ